jgi:adenylate cyclase
MALFGVGPGGGNHAQQAVDAGQAMLCCLDDAREELERAGWPGLAIGIGINSGQAIVGSIGSPRRQEYTAIGDTVNVAARVEALTKQVGRMLLITEATRERLKGETRVESLPAQQVKGKGEAVRIYAVEGGERAG